MSAGTKLGTSYPLPMDDMAPYKAIEAWVEEALKDPDTGLPPVPLKLVLGSPNGRGILIGQYQGGEVPKGGTRFRSVELQVSFPGLTSPEVMAWTAKTIVWGLAEDPTLCGRLGTGRLVYKEHSVQEGAGTYGDQSDLLTVHALLSTLEPQEAASDSSST